MEDMVRKFSDRLTRYGIDMSLYELSNNIAEDDGREGELWFDHKHNDCQIRCYFRFAVMPTGEISEAYSMAMAIKDSASEAAR